MEYLVLIAKVGFVIVAILMILMILLQEGKGGGLAALGGTRAETAFGASNPIRRLTVYLAIFFFLLCGFISWAQKPHEINPATGGDAQKQGSGENKPKAETPAATGDEPKKAEPENGAAAPASGAKAGDAPGGN